MSRRGAARGSAASGTRRIPNPDAERELEQLRARLAALEREALALRDAEVERDEFAELYELGPLPALTLDGAYHIRRANPAAVELFGEARERLESKSFRSFVAAEHRPSLSQHLARAAGQATTQCCRLRMEPARKPSIPVELWTRFSLRRNSFEVMLVDLRENERLQEEARRLSEAERIAREESAAKDKFIAVLSHELRTPLTPVLAAASAQRRASHVGDLRDVFEMIERNVSAEARLIDDLLDVNRIVRNKMQVDRQPTDVHDVALLSLQDLQADAHAKQQELTTDLAAAYHVARVDPTRLRQVFSNLLKNAVKFTPQGGKICFSSWNGEGKIAIEIEDNGAGIDPEAMQHLFEPFSELRASIPSGGLGLGLAISKGLVELQGGQIFAHSRGRGRGSRFVVELPVIRAEALEASSPRISPPPRAPGEGQPRRVLLVEDHPDTVEVLSALLVQKGFAVETATSVESARQVDLERVDVIVSDIGLPDGTGLELIRELRVRSKRPAIALTGFGMESDVRASLAAGFDLHLTKPVNIERLVDAIHSLAEAP